MEPPEYELPTVAALRTEWHNIPNEDALNVIAVEAQYLAFHTYLLSSLRHRSPAGGAAIPIGLSVRAGALKTTTLLCASIAEAALRAHAEARGYALPQEERRRTFGAVLSAWKVNGQPRQELTGIWEKLDVLQSGRNNIHLYKVIQEGGDFYELLHAENASLTNAQQVLTVIKGVVS